MKRFVNLFLAVLFALLQCIAPVAHAHINTSSMDNGMHLPEVGLQDGHGANELNCGDPVWESSAVSASQGCELHCTRTASDQHAFYIAYTPQYAAEEATEAYRNPFHTVVIPPAESLKPYPQAPPASTLL